MERNPWSWQLHLRCSQWLYRRRRSWPTFHLAGPTSRRLSSVQLRWEERKKETLQSTFEVLDNWYKSKTTWWTSVSVPWASYSLVQSHMAKGYQEGFFDAPVVQVGKIVDFLYFGQQVSFTLRRVIASKSYFKEMKDWMKVFIELLRDLKRFGAIEAEKKQVFRSHDLYQLSCCYSTRIPYDLSE